MRTRGTRRCHTPRMDVVDLAEKFGKFTDTWSPKVVARLNDYEVKLAKLDGEFVWHDHPDTDELFLVLDGSLTVGVLGTMGLNIVLAFGCWTLFRTGYRLRS